MRYILIFIGLTVVHVRLVYGKWRCNHSLLGKRIHGGGIVLEMNLRVSCQLCEVSEAVSAVSAR
jgi:hypothetical protein